MSVHNKNWIAGRFRPKEKLGEGTYGVTFISQDTSKNNSYVVIKQIRNRRSANGIDASALQEIRILSELDHPNIVKYVGAFYHISKLYIATEYVPLSLNSLIHQEDTSLSRNHIKCLFKMILQGVDYLHSNFILHRDLKPDNILITLNGIVKIIDFGLACHYPPDESRLTSVAFTSYYKPPEVFFDDNYYGPSSDVWSLGCIFGEMLKGDPLFPGNSDFDVLQRIANVLGPIVWNGCDKLKSFIEIRPNTQLMPLQKHFSAVEPDAIDLLKRMLTLNPAERISCHDALNHPYFSLPPEISLPCDLPLKNISMKSFQNASTMIITSSMYATSSLVGKNIKFAPGTARLNENRQ